MVVWKVSCLHPVARFKLGELEQLNRDKELTSNLKTPFSSNNRFAQNPDAEKIHLNGLFK